MQQRFLHCVTAVVLALAPLSVGQTVSAAASSSHPAQTGSPASAVQATVSSTGLANGLRREVFGFALASSLSDPGLGMSTWDFRLLSTVAFFGLHINSSGKLVADSQWSVWSSSALTSLVSTAHAHGTRVVLTIVMQDFSGSNATMCSALANRANTVAQTVAQVKAKAVDGVNVDYEGLNATCPNGLTTRSLFVTFMHDLRAALPSTSYVSIDTYASSASDPAGFFDVPALNASVDAFFVMAYDLEYSNWRHAPLNCASFCLGPTAPLTGYYYNDTSTTAQYVAAVPASKVILGVPYYGRKACVGAGGANGAPTGSVSADSYVSAIQEPYATTVLSNSYSENVDAHDAAGRERWATWYNTSLRCTRELYWDDPASLGAKYNLINANNLRGVGIWTLNYGGGVPELWQALRQHFVGCSAVSAAASPAPPALSTTAVTFTASATCPDPNPLYEFWVKAPNATRYTLGQAYSTSATFNWKTAGLIPGTYRLNVWVRDASSTGAFHNSSGAWDAYNAGVTYALTSDPCNSVSASSSLRAAMIGTAVKVSATAGGCANPSYEFWLLAPGASAYRIAQPYSSSSTFQWSTAGRAPGSYRVNVWVRDASSVGVAGNASGRWDAYNASLVVRLTKGCPSVGISSAPPGSAPVGTAVGFSATASGCSTPLYEYWILYPGQKLYRLAQAYSTKPTLGWNTASMPLGAYRLNVWVRNSTSAGVYGNSSGRWDAYNASYVFTLTPSCTSVSDSASPGSVAAGATVKVTAHAAGCPDPVYEFWVLAPGASSYTLAQPYSTSAQLDWPTAGLAPGTYRITVWARDSTSDGVSSNASGRWDAYNANLVVGVT